MDTVIKIYNPKDTPFGQLSNNSEHSMIINGKRWGTVTNYIFSNLLVTPEYKSILQYASVQKDSKKDLPDKSLQIIENVQESTGARLTTEDKKRIKKGTTVQKMDIYEMYRHYADLEFLENVRTSLEKAYNLLISENPTLQDTLLNTENYPIVYVSDNATLGTGEDGNGYNMVGKTLMQIRHNIRLRINEEKVREHKEVREDQIFTAYKAFMILQHELNKGNDLCKCLNKTAKDVLEESPGLLQETGIKDDIKPTIIQMYNRGLFPIIGEELRNPGSMVVTMRRKGLPILKEKAETARVKIIVDIYTQYIVKEKNPAWESSKIKAAALQLFDSLYNMQSTEIKDPDLRDQIVSEKYSEFKNRIVRLFEDGKLPEKVSGKINKKLEKIHIPDEKEIEDAENPIQNSERGSSATNSRPDSLEETGSESESDSEADSSSSVDIKDPLSRLFIPDHQATHLFLLRKLKEYIGEKASKSKYKKMTNDELQAEILKFEGPTATKDPVEGLGEWVLKIKDKHNRVKILQKFKTRPSERDIQNALDKYNYNKPEKVTTKQTFVNWVSHEKAKHVQINESENKKYDPPSEGFVKEFGPTVQISSVIGDNEQALRPFCPIYQKIIEITDDSGQKQQAVQNLIIDGLTYPNISVYIIAKLLTITGSHKDSHNIMCKGMSISEARNMLITPDGLYFLQPHEADELYEKFRDESENNLKELFARIGMLKKFEDMNLKILLLVTNNAELVWDDKKDLFFGFDTEEDAGSNVIGRILMELRELYQTNDKYKIHFPKINRKQIHNFITKDSFMISWINMRVNDMSNTVYKFKQYLYNTTGQEEDIDKDFVTFILDKVLQPCSYVIAISKILEIDIPEFFTNIVSNSKGLTITVDPSYKEEADKIKEEMRRFIQQYNNTREERPFEPKKEFDIIGFARQQSKELDDFLRTNPTEEQLEQFYARQKKKSDKILFDKRIGYEVKKSNASEEKDTGIEARQRAEWDELLKTINEREMTPDEVEEKMHELTERHKEELENTDFLVGPREEALNKRLAEETQQLRDSLEMTEEEADRRLDELKVIYENSDPDTFIQNILRKNPSLSQTQVSHEVDKRLAEIDQRREELGKAKLYAVEVRQKIEELEKKHAKAVKKLRKHPERLSPYVSEKMDLEKKHEEEREELMDEISRVKMSQKDRNKKMIEMTKKQNEDRLVYYNLRPVKKTREEQAKYQKDMDEFKERLLRINQKVKHIINEKTNVVERIAEVYWNRIVSMVIFLIDHIKDSNEQDIRRIIASIEMLNSRPTSCEFSYGNTVANLDDERDNCIASAIANLLVGINTFKSQYGEDIPFDKPDIDLAVSVILNKDISDQKVEYKEGEDDDIIPEDLLDQIEMDSALPSDVEDDGDYGGDDLIDEESGGGGNSAEFGMARKKIFKLNNNLESIKIILRSIAGREVKNLDALANYFLNMITTVKTYKMSEKVKQNRINFFSTIR